MLQLDELTLESLIQALRGSADRPEAALFPEAADANKWRESRMSPSHAPFWREVSELAEMYKNNPANVIPFSTFMQYAETGDRRQYEQPYFDRRRQLAVYALLCLSGDDSGWELQLEDIMWAICDEFTWVLPAHIGNDLGNGNKTVWKQTELPRETLDLFAAETAFALAEIISLCRARLNPWVVRRVEQEIERRIFRVYFHNPAPQLWEPLNNNWPAVCASAAGAAALYLVGDFERLVGMIWRVLQSLKNYINGYGEDGASHEGITYWQFGFGNFVYFAELLRDRTGGRIQLLQGERMARISRFPNAMILSAGKSVNFSDAREGISWQAGLFRRLHRYFPEVQIPADSRPEVKWTKMESFPVWSRDLLWDMELAGVTSDAPPQRNDYFPQVGWVVSRSNHVGGLIALAAKGGHNGESHNHNDLGHFILHVRGENVLADLGAGDYTRAYFGGNRYQLLHNGSHGHSVPVIDGSFQLAGGQHRADILYYRETEGGIAFALELSKAYDVRTLRSFQREFVWEYRPDEERNILQLRDTFEFNRQPDSLAEVFITTFPPEMVEPGCIVIHQTVRLEYDARLYRYELDKVLLSPGDADGPVVYRMILHLLHPALHGTHTFRFICGGATPQ